MGKKGSYQSRQNITFSAETPSFLVKLKAGDDPKDPETNDKKDAPETDDAPVFEVSRGVSAEEAAEFLKQNDPKSAESRPIPTKLQTKRTQKHKIQKEQVSKTQLKKLKNTKLLSFD